MNSFVYNNKKLAQRVKLLIYYDICCLPYYISQLKKNNDYVSHRHFINNRFVQSSKTTYLNKLKISSSFLIENV